MLSPAKLDKLPEPMVKLMSQLQDEIISDLCRRITKANYLTPTAEWQLYKANQLRLSYMEINRRIAKQLKVRERTVKKLYTDTVKEAIHEDALIYRRAIAEGKLDGNYGDKLDSYTRSTAFSNVLNQGLKNTNGLMRNLTNSTAAIANRQLSDALDLAFLKVANGAFTPAQAVFDAVKTLGTQGIKSVTYKSSRTDQIDVAVRRAVLTGINKTVCDMQLSLANEMDSELVEVSSHIGARPTHAQWQGQIYSLKKGHSKYPYFYDATLYGRGDGLGGWNCRHSFFPFFEGISLPANAPNFSKEENLKEYNESQEQRSLERGIRKSKRELAALEASRNSTADTELKIKLDKEFSRKAVTLKKREARLEEFCKRTGNYPDSARVRVDGFGKSVSQKAVWAEKKAVDKENKSGIINTKQQSDLGTFKKHIQSDNRITKEYYSVIKNKFSHGSDIAKKTFSKFVPQNSVIDASYENTAFYDTTTKKISMHYGADLRNKRGNGATWFHEHGHLIDDFAGNISNNKEFKKLLDNDYLNYMKTYGKKNNLNTFDKVQKAIGNDLSNMREHSAVSDLLNGISKGNIRGIAKHDAEYWKDDSVYCSEAFAHMYEAQFDKTRYKEMKKYFPTALVEFERILKGVL